MGGVAWVFEIDRSEAGEGETMSAVAGRQHAVEHIDAAGHRLEQVLGRAYSHEVARAIGREPRHAALDDPEHNLLRLAHGDPTTGIALKIDVNQHARPPRAPSR